MGRSLALVAVAVFLVGCAGASFSPPQLGAGPLRSLARSQSHSVAPQQSSNCPANPGGSGILADGDFSQASIPPGGQGLALRKGTIFAPGWIVTGPKTIDFNGPGNPNWQPPNGLCNVDLDGTPGPGGIKHSSFATKRGAKYTVAFLFSGNGACPPTVKTMNVLAGRSQFTQFLWDTSNGNDAQNGKFAQETWGFTAFHTSTTLSFESKDPVGNCGPIVAAISVTRN